MPLDMQKLDVFMSRFVGDLGATFNAGLVVIGQSLGLYKALANGPQTPAELAKATQTDERYVREWLSALLDRRGPRLARARCRTVPRYRAVLPAGVRGESRA